MDKQQLSQVIDFLKEVSFFSEVSKEALSHLAKDLSTKSFKKNQTIFKKNDPGDSMYVILKGKVKIHEKEHVFGELTTKDCFGEYALIDNKERSASVTAIEETQVLEIPRDHFLHLMANDTGFNQGVLAVLIKRHRELDSIQERLAVSKEELAAASAKMSGLINGAMDAIIMFDANFRIILANPSAMGLIENRDVLQRNVLFFLEDESASLLESLINENNPKTYNTYLPEPMVVIGSNETRVITEGTLSKYGEAPHFFYTLILRNIEGRLKAEETISFLTSQAKYLNEEINDLTNTYGIQTEDKGMRKVLELTAQVAKTDATVLINGETGTGKELVARAIHSASNRSDKPLIRINCGAIPANLIESELFGHEKGAFTGATVSRKGRFLLADKGTLFLDEIGELPIDLQPKLLRVIQEGEFDPVGSNETIKVDVRIIAATHRDLMRHAAEGKFREDLFYRLNVFPITVPALRDRGNDVCLIAQEMMRKYAKKLNKPIADLTPDDKELLLAYQWPGNVRELQNLVERAVIVSQNGNIDWGQIIPRSKVNEATLSKTEDTITSTTILTSEELIALEKANILKALKVTGWKISGSRGAAQLLKMVPTTLTSKMKALGIVRPS